MKINHSFQINSLLKWFWSFFNFNLRKIVLQEVCVGGGSILKLSIQMQDQVCMCIGVKSIDV
jgi:hypothetical protein